MTMMNCVILEIPAGPRTTVICMSILFFVILLLYRLLKKSAKNEADIPKDSILQNKDFDILYWGEARALKEVFEEIDKRGFRPATAEEVEFNFEKIIDLEEHFPEFQRHLPIVTLGSIRPIDQKSIALSYQFFSYEEDQKSGEFHVVSASMSSIKISNTVCQFAVVKK